MQKDNPDWINDRPYDGQISTSRTCPNCKTMYGDHMLAMSCQISDCGAKPFTKALDDALERVPFEYRGKICAAFYQGLVFPIAQRTGNKAWQSREFKRAVFDFCREAYDTAKHRPAELEAFAQTCMEMAYGQTGGEVIAPATIHTQSPADAG